MACNGYIISIQESALFRPGKKMSPSFSVNGVRVDDDGEKVATINGTNLPASKLRVGESVTQKDAGRFTLTGITPASGEAKFGGGGIAHFCYEPAPGFELSPGVADGNWRGRPANREKRQRQRPAWRTSIVPTSRQIAACPLSRAAN